MKIYMNYPFVFSNKIKNPFIQKYTEIYSQEGIFIIEETGIYKKCINDIPIIIIDDFMIDLSTYTKQLVYQIPNINLTVNTYLIKVTVDTKMGIYFMVEENYDNNNNNKIGENYYFISEKSNELNDSIKKIIYVFLSSLH